MPRWQVLGVAAEVAAITLVSLSCGSHGEMTTHPTVVLDPTFTPAEVAQIRAGLASWDQRGPSVALAIQTASDRDTLANAAASGGEPNTIYVVREIAHSCAVLYSGGSDPAEPIAFTVWNPNGSTSTCLDADRLDAAEPGQANVFKAVVAHEIGHSFGLAHDDVGVAAGAPESIMTTYHQNEPADGEVTCRDVRGVAAHFALAVPAACAAR